MSFFNFLFSFKRNATSMPDIFPMSVKMGAFVSADMRATFKKILIDVVERTDGIPDKLQPLLWDNCLANEVSHGLIFFLADAMVDRKDLFLVYDPTTITLARASVTEQERIRIDYETKGKSNVGVFISFKGYEISDLIKILSEMTYGVMNGLHKTVNIAKAVQIKINELRASVSLNDSQVAIDQAQDIADGLSQGRDVVLDKNDEITTASPDVGPSEKAMEFLDKKRAFYLNLPLSYITGEQTTGIGSTGEADMRATERGLKQFYFSVIKPALKAIFNIDSKFRSQDFRQITSVLETMKTFDLTSNNYMSGETKQVIVARMAEIDPQEEAARIKKEQAQALKEQPRITATQTQLPSGGENTEE